ncbi:MAG TPA: SIMPL domain-containing protein, partial [Anaerolineaceae bacterium]|nr:SIMPL domain-containing protein [Anaerolineaceae bacterium]
MKTKLSIFSLVVLLIAALTLSGCALFQPQQQTTAPANLRTLSVSGSGNVVLVPDIAYINIGVHSEAPDVSSSLSTNNAQATAISNALQAEGVDAKDIQTANFNVYPTQHYDNMGQVTGTYYVVDNTVYVTVRNLSKLPKLLDVAISSGANS